MQGWLYNSAEAFFKETQGAEKWLQILSESGVSALNNEASNGPLAPDKMIDDIIIAGSKVIGTPKGALMEEYGAFLVSYIMQLGHAKLLKVLGGDIIEFLDNLNNLYLHLALAYTSIIPQTFRCEQVTPESLELHYYCPLVDMHHAVSGALKALAKEVFNVHIAICLLQSRDKGADHEVFLLKYPFQDSMRKRAIKAQPIASDPFEPFEMSPLLFAELHPFHIVMDKHFMVLQCGQVIARLIPGLTSGCHIQEHVRIKMPHVGYSWEEIRKESNGPFLLQTLVSGLDLKGQMLFTGLPIPGCPHEQEVLVFMGSPRCNNLSDLQRHRLFLSDIPIHDMSGDFVLLAEQRQAESDLKERFERLTCDLKDEKARSDALVQRMSGLLACFPFKAAKENGGGAMVSMGQSFTSSECRNEAQDWMDLIEAVRRAMGPITSLVGNDEQIELVQAIGEGTYGKVYRGLWQGTEVAVKTIILPANMSGSEKREKMAIMEAAISSSLSHPNVVQTYTYSIKPMRDNATAAVAGRAGIHGMTGSFVEEKPLGESVPSSNELHLDLGAAGIVLGGASEMYSEAPGAVALAMQAAPTQTPPQPPTQPLVSALRSNNDGRDADACQGGTPVLLKSRHSHNSKLHEHSSKSGSSGGAIHSYEIRLVLEFCDRGSLRDVLDDNIFRQADGSINYKAILDTALDIAKAMLHLHRNDVLHADLKARNIMLRSAGDNGKGFIAKVADFGLSVKINPDETHMSDMCQGTLTHMAPELMLDGQMSKAADVYAFGILLWELFTAGSPYKGTPRALLGHQVTAQDKRPVFPTDTPPEYRKLAVWCWDKDPKVRPIFEEVMQDLIEMRREQQGPTPLALKPPGANTPSAQSSQPGRLPVLHGVGQAGESGESFYPSGTEPPKGMLLDGDEATTDFGSALVGESLNTEA